MKQINSLAELKAERARLKMQQFRLENDIRNDIDELKQELNPLKLAAKGAESMLVNHNHGLVNQSVGIITDFLLKKVLFRNSGFLLRLVVPFFTKNAASNYVHDHKTQILGWLGDIVMRFGNKNHKHKEPVYDSGTVNGHY